MPDEPHIYQSEIDDLSAAGYCAINLNADSDLPRVHGPNWVMYAPDGKVIAHEYRELDAWIAARIYSRF
jgi:hypothetical protein